MQQKGSQRLKSWGGFDLLLLAWGWRGPCVKKYKWSLEAEGSLFQQPTRKWELRHKVTRNWILTTTWTNLKVDSSLEHYRHLVFSLLRLYIGNPVEPYYSTVVKNTTVSEYIYIAFLKTTIYTKVGEKWKQCQILYCWVPKSLWMVTAATKLKHSCFLGKKSYDKTRQHNKKQRYHFVNKGPSSQSYGFSSSHVWMWELDHKESWALKNWCFWTVMLGKTLECLLNSKEIKPVNPKGNQLWIFTGRTDGEAEAPILCPPDQKSWLIGKDPDAGKDWRQ